VELHNEVIAEVPLLKAHCIFFLKKHRYRSAADVHGSLLKKLASAGEVKPEEVSMVAGYFGGRHQGCSLWQNFGCCKNVSSMPAGGASSEMAFTDTLLIQLPLLPRSGILLEIARYS